MENIMARRTKKPGAELAQQIIAQYKPQTVEDMEGFHCSTEKSIRSCKLKGMSSRV